jgi:hypothetical protein
MSRHKNLVTVIREMVREEVNAAIAGLLGATRTQAKTRRRRRRGGKWRPGGPGPAARGEGGASEEEAEDLILALASE